MIDLVFSFFGSPKLVAIVGIVGSVLAALFGMYRKGKADAHAKDDARRQKEQLAAQQAQSDMRAEGQAVKQGVERMTDEEARQEALSWSKP